MSVDFSTLNYKYTKKQLTALHHYVVNGNKVEAYRFAYDVDTMKEKTIVDRAKDLWRTQPMKNAVVLIQAAALERQNKTMDQIVIDAAWVLKRTALLADFNIKRFIKFNAQGEAYYDFSEATDDDWYCISEYTVDTLQRGSGDDKYNVDRVKIKTVDKLKALELVGKHIDVQAFKEQIEQSGTVTHVNMDKDQYLSARKEMLEQDEC